VERDGSALRMISDAFGDDKRVVLATVKQHGSALQYALENLKGEKEVVLAAVMRDGLALRYASEPLNGDKDVVLAAVKQNGSALEHASGRLRNDGEVVLAAVEQHGYALRYASGNLRADKGMVLAAVKTSGHALEHTSNDVRGDKGVVLAAVKQHGLALEHASEELRGDEEVVLSAVKQSGFAMQYASAKLRGDKEFMRTATRKSPCAFFYASATLKADEAVFFEALRACCHVPDSSLTVEDVSTLMWMHCEDDINDRCRAFLEMKELVFANHLAFPGTPGAVVFELLESYFDASTSKWHCRGLRGLGGDSFSVELPRRESGAPSFAQLSKALTKGHLGSFIYLVSEGKLIDPLEGEKPIPIIEQPSGQKRPREQEQSPPSAKQQEEQAQQYRRSDDRSPSRRRGSPAALDFASLSFLPGMGARASSRLLDGRVISPPRSIHDVSLSTLNLRPSRDLARRRQHEPRSEEMSISI